MDQIFLRSNRFQSRIFLITPQQPVVRQFLTVQTITRLSKSIISTRHRFPPEFPSRFCATLDPPLASRDRWHVLKVRVARKKMEEDTRRAAAIWRARVSVHYPRPKYKSGWIRVRTMYFWQRVFHPESSYASNLEGGREDRWYFSWNILSATGELGWSPLEWISVFYNYRWLLRGISTRGRNSRRIIPSLLPYF